MSGRGWGYKGKTYDEALACVRKYQKNRKTLQIANNTTLVINDDDETVDVCMIVDYTDHDKRQMSKYIDVVYYGSVIVKYLPDGSCILPYNGRWAASISTRDRINTYSPARVIQHRGRMSVLVPGRRTEPKVQKCRMCHGYKWNGQEAEEILYELTREWKHFKACWKCSGTGRADYGSKPLAVPYVAGMRILPDGTPVDEGMIDEV